MSNILLMPTNYVSADRLNGQSVSSELAAAPAVNIYDKVRRSKVWRSAGYFEVTNANRGIVLQEVNTVNQTVNIATGTYTTDATFLAAVKAALDGAAGSAVYTVTRDSTTNKIVITSDGGGGAILKLMCTNVAFTAADLLGFSILADRTGGLTYTADSIRIHTSEWIRWDLGSQFNPEAFAMIGGKAAGLKISSTATLTLEGNSTDVWTAPAYSQVLTWNEDCIAMFDSGGLHTTGLRYWRLNIVDKDNANGFVEISNVYLGEVFEPSLGAVQFPFDWVHVDYSIAARSEWGTGFSNKRNVVRELTLKWFGLTISEQELMADFVEEFGTSYPFWICLDPNEVFSSDLQRWVVYARFQDELPGFPLEKPGIFSSQWKIREEA